MKKNIKESSTNVEDKKNRFKKRFKTSNTSEHKRGGKFWNKTRIISAGVISSIVSVVLGAGFALYGIPFVKNFNAQKELDSVSQRLSDGSVTVLASTVVSYDVDNDKIPSGASTEQVKLSYNDGSEYSGATLVWQSESNISEDTKTVDLYVDLSSQSSRDFLLLNQNTLYNLVQSGTIILRVHLVPSDSTSLLLYEGLIRAYINNYNEVAWDTLFNLTKLSASLELNNIVDTDTIVSKIVSTLDQGLISAYADGALESSIKTGSFSAWVLSTAEDEKLAVSFYPPIVYINGGLVDENSALYNGGDSLVSEILTH